MVFPGEKERLLYGLACRRRGMGRAADPEIMLSPGF
jgi:hypothetical protein